MLKWVAGLERVAAHAKSTRLRVKLQIWSTSQTHSRCLAARNLYHLSSARHFLGSLEALMCGLVDWRWNVSVFGFVLCAGIVGEVRLVVQAGHIDTTDYCPS